MNKLNKKGAGKILSLYWFAILFLIAGGIFLMTYLFYGTPYDVREIEARILTNRVADCVSYSGRINPNLIADGLFLSNNENFLENCYLIFDSTEWPSEQYYAEVSFYNLNDLNNSLFNLKKGSSSLLGDCQLQKSKDYDNLAQCNEGEFYSTDMLNNQYIIKILTIVRKSEKNVKL